jgi:hypothetical protein
MSTLLDPFIPHADICERHEIIVPAPAALVLQIAQNFDIQSILPVRAIFWLRSKVMRAKVTRNEKKAKGFMEEMLGLGWVCLAKDRNWYFCAGAACQPWRADITFSPVPPDLFASFAQPGRVKIAWTLEVEALEPAVTRLATETRVVATDEASRIKFKHYWRTFAIGILMIRRLLLRAIRREASREWQARSH